MDPVFTEKFVSGHQKIFSFVVDRILDSGAKVIGFSLFYNNELFSLQLARAIKKRDPSRYIVFGGPQASRLQGALLSNPEVDAVVIREGEAPFNDLVEALSSGGTDGLLKGVWTRKDKEPVFGGEQNPNFDLNTIPDADFSDFPLKDYLSPGMLPSFVSRGCFKKCVFCDVNLYSKQWRVRSGERIFGEFKRQMERYPEVNYFYFYDPIINGEMKSLEDFCDLIIEEKKINPEGPFKDIRWAGNAIVRPDMKFGILEKMARSGCDHINYGIESGSQNVIRSMRKGYLIKTAEEVLRLSTEAGIKTHIFYMVGFPTETEEDFEEGLRFLKRNADFISQVNPSESFTSIDYGTTLADNPDEFGVPDASHGAYWESQNGKNTYPVRLERFERLCKFVDNLDIKLGSGFDKVETFKKEMLQQYKEHTDRIARRV